MYQDMYPKARFFEAINEAEDMGLIKKDQAIGLKAEFIISPIGYILGIFLGLPVALVVAMTSAFIGGGGVEEADRARYESRGTKNFRFTSKN